MGYQLATVLQTFEESDKASSDGTVRTFRWYWVKFVDTGVKQKRRQKYLKKLNATMEGLDEFRPNAGLLREGMEDDNKCSVHGVKQQYHGGNQNRSYNHISGRSTSSTNTGDDW